jgi:hypothetical protein
LREYGEAEGVAAKNVPPDQYRNSRITASLISGSITLTDFTGPLNSGGKPGSLPICVAITTPDGNACGWGPPIWTGVPILNAASAFIESISVWGSWGNPTFASFFRRASPTCVTDVNGMVRTRMDNKTAAAVTLRLMFRLELAFRRTLLRVLPKAGKTFSFFLFSSCLIVSSELIKVPPLGGLMFVFGHTWRCRGATFPKSVLQAKNLSGVSDCGSDTLKPDASSGRCHRLVRQLKLG